MGVSYDYFRAADDAAASRLGAVIGGPTVAGHPGVVPTTWVDPMVRVGHLYAMVSDQPWTPKVLPVATIAPDVPSHPESWDVPTVERIDDAARDVLADIDEGDIDQLGEWWATTQEFVRDGTDPKYVADLCGSLMRLFRDARDEDEHVYVWSSL